MSLMAAASEALICSSSFSRSLMGRVSRCTYFLLAKGCVTRLARLGSSPSQISPLLTGGSGSRFACVVDCWALVELFWASTDGNEPNARVAIRSDVASWGFMGTSVADRASVLGSAQEHIYFNARFCTLDGKAARARRKISQKLLVSQFDLQRQKLWTTKDTKDHEGVT